MSYLPIFVDVRGRACLVVGGGSVGRRKVSSLLEREAVVRVVGRELVPELRALADQGRIEYLGPEYRTDHLDGAALVYAATSDNHLNVRVSRDAQQRGIFVNVADVPELCTFIVPAQMRQGDLTIAVSTGGRSPAAAASIRRKLEKDFGPEYAKFLKIMGLVREKVLAGGRPPDENKRKFEDLVNSGMIERLKDNDPDGAEEIMTRVLGPGYTFMSIGYESGGGEAA